MLVQHVEEENMEKFLRIFARFSRKDRLDGVQGISTRIAVWTNDRMTGNRVTILGMLLSIPGLWFFAIDWLWSGIFMMALSFLTDWWDGALARFHEDKSGRSVPITLEQERQLTLWQRINYRGVTHLGKELDPFADKFRFVPLMWILGYGKLWTWMLVGITVVAVLLTAVRPLKRYFNLDGASTRIGKYKIWGELVGLCIMVFIEPFMVKPVNIDTAIILANVAFLTAFVLGLGSLLSHAATGVMDYRRQNSHRRKEPDGERIRP